MNSRFLLLALPVACGLSSGCAHLRHAAAEYRARDRDVADIYTLFLSEWTATSKRDLPVAIRADPPEPRTLESIPECAQSKAHWTPPKPIPNLVNILGSLEGVQITNNYNPRQLLKHSLMTLSAISFDETNQTAALTYSYYCGGLCGSGSTIIFTKSGETWVRRREECNGWIS